LDSISPARTNAVNSNPMDELGIDDVNNQSTHTKQKENTRKHPRHELGV